MWVRVRGRETSFSAVSFRFVPFDKVLIALTKNKCHLLINKNPRQCAIESKRLDLKRKLLKARSTREKYEILFKTVQQDDSRK